MGVKISQGFTRTGKFPIDETLLLTKAQMLAINDNLMPEKYFTLCLDDGKFYIYNKSATPSVETGKFTVFEGGTGTNDYNDLINQPTLEGEVIKGDMSLSDLGILDEAEIEDLIDSKIEDSEGNLIFYTKDETYSKNEVYSKDETYSKEEVYTKEEVDDLIELLPKFEIKVVEELPTKDISTTTIYLVPRQDSEGSNVYEEYIYVDKKWELIGTTDIDLSDYYTISEVDALLDEKQDVLAAGTGINIENNIISVDDTEIATKEDIDTLTNDINDLAAILDSEGNRIDVLESELDNLEIPYFETTLDSEGSPIVNIISGDNMYAVGFDPTDDGYIISVDDGVSGSSKELVSKEYVDEVAGQEHVELTQAEYDVLPPEKKLDGTIYFVTDGESGGSNVQMSADGSKKEIAISDDNGNKLNVALNDSGKIKLHTESPMLFGVDKYLQEEAVVFNVNSTVYSYDDFYDVINNHKAAYIVGYDSIETVLYIECYMEGAMLYSTNGWSVRTYYWASDGSGEYKIELPQSRNIAFSDTVFNTYRIGSTYKYDFNKVHNEIINLSRVVYITNSQCNKILISSALHEGTLGTANSAIVCYGTDGNTIYTFRMAQNLDPNDNTSYFVETRRDYNVLTAPNGDMFRVKVANDGSLSTEAVV